MQSPIRFAAAFLFMTVVSVTHAAGKIAIADYCDPTDPAWESSGGCFLRDGDVTFAELAAEITRLDATFDIHASREDALSAVQSGPAG